MTTSFTKPLPMSSPADTLDRPNSPILRTQADCTGEAVERLEVHRTTSVISKSRATLRHCTRVRTPVRTGRYQAIQLSIHAFGSSDMVAAPCSALATSHEL